MICLENGELLILADTHSENLQFNKVSLFRIDADGQFIKRYTYDIQDSAAVQGWELLELENGEKLIHLLIYKSPGPSKGESSTVRINDQYQLINENRLTEGFHIYRSIQESDSSFISLGKDTFGFTLDVLKMNSSLQVISPWLNLGLYAGQSAILELDNFFFISSFKDANSSGLFKLNSSLNITDSLQIAPRAYLSSRSRNKDGFVLYNHGLRKYNTSLNLEWQKDYSEYSFGYNSEFQYSRGVINSPNSGYLLYGIVDLTFLEPFVYMVGTDEQGNKVWSQEYLNFTFKDILNVVEATNGGYYCLMSGGNDSSNIPEIIIARTNSDGIITAIKPIERREIPFQIFPNPSYKQVVIRFPTLDKGIINIYSINGEKISAQTVNNESEVHFNTSGYTQGLYMVELIDSNSRRKEIKKFLKIN